jgi:hypothetical protein
MIQQSACGSGGNSTRLRVGAGALSGALVLFFSSSVHLESRIGWPTQVQAVSRDANGRHAKDNGALLT